MALPRVFVLYTLWLSAVLNEASSLQIVIVPKRAHLNKNGDNLTVTCNADQPIRHCQFNFIKDETVKEGPLIDLSEGAKSLVDPEVLGTSIVSYKYTGSGLAQGQCGITLRLTNWKRYMLGCRVKGVGGGWRYDIMSFTADGSRSVPVTVSPSNTIVALPGTDQSILCRARGPIEWCRMDLPGPQKKHIFLDQGAASPDSTPEHKYHGAGLDKGECGVTLAAVTDEWNGYAFCGVVPVGGNGWERTGIPVVVARAPNKPDLQLDPAPLYEGGLLEATCTVSGGRPPANITWYLDEKVVRSDDEDDKPDDLWRWPTSLQRTTQRLRHRLRPGDNGKTLRCEAAHVMLPRPLSASKTIQLIPVGNLCPPLSSDSIQLSCYLGGETLDCGEPQQVGTIANLRCKPGYEYPPNVFYRRITCGRGGEWNRELFRCHPDCGRRKTNRGSVLVAGGVESSVGEFPWHAGVYEATSEGEDPRQTCGATIITPNVLISAAHCFWDVQKSSLKDAKRYRVAAGKQRRVWDDTDAAVQKREVREVVPHARFRGREGNFASDVALIRLVTAFEITLRVNLVCMDWDNTFEHRQLSSGSAGVAAGWGYTEAGEQSDNLMYVSLPYVPADTCLDALPEYSVQLLTADKFCAGYANRTTSVCRGDSGGGLFFRDRGTEKYYLRGVISIAFPPPGQRNVCYSELYTGFTRISQYIPWVQENIH